MGFDIKATSAAWERLNQRDWAVLPTSVRVERMPSFPLARAIRMPKDLPFELGSLALRLNELNISSPDGFVPEIESVSGTDRGVRIALRFGKSTIQGSHALECKQVWDAGIDGAGTGLMFDDDGRVRRPGGADENKNPTWIATAKKQRDKLTSEDINKEKDNGMQLVSTYTDHRQAFTDVLTETAGYAFQSQWGVPHIKDMAGHTNDCVNNGGEINNDETKYAGNTYNVNAGLQQLAMITALAGMPGATEDDKPVASNQYQKALAATLSFKGSVLQNTDSKKVDNIPTKTADGVYDIVKTGTPGPEVTVEQAHRLLNGDEIGGRCADGTKWSMALTEDERAFVRDLRARQQEHNERVAQAKPVAVVSGAAVADLQEFHMYLEFTVADDGTLELADGRVELDSFDLDLDDSEWPEAVATIARQELSTAKFIRSLLHDRVADALERDLVSAAADVLGSSAG